MTDIKGRWQATMIVATVLLSRTESIEASPSIIHKLSTGVWVSIDQWKTERHDRNILSVIKEPELIEILENAISLK